MKKIFPVILLTLLCATKAISQQQEYYTPNDSYLWRGDYTAQWMFEIKDSVGSNGDFVRVYSDQFRVKTLSRPYQSGTPKNLVWSSDSGIVNSFSPGTNGQLIKSTGSSVAWFTPTYLVPADTISLSSRITAVSKKQETFSGTTNASGIYTVTFSSAYSVAPNIQANIIGGANTNLIKITSVSTTGFTVTVVNRVDVVGLLPSYVNVNGASVDVLITEK